MDSRSPRSDLAASTASLSSTRQGARNKPLGRSSPDWRRDSEAKECAGCSQPFTLTRRRHHCRACGGIFCSACSKEREAVDGDVYGDKQRVCDGCALGIADERGTPLWRLLGPILAPLHYHALAKHGDADTLAALSPEQRAELFDELEIAEVHRADLGQKLDDRRWLNLAAGSSPGVPHSPAAVSPTSLAGDSLEQYRDRLKEELQGLHRSCDMLTKCLSDLVKRREDEERQGGSLQQLQDEVLAYHASVAKAQEDRRRRAAAMKLAAGVISRSAGERRGDFGEGKHHCAECALCSARYTLTAREHHCRVCFQSVCAKCSRTRSHRGERRCDHCATVATLASSGGSDASRWLLRVRDDEHTCLSTAKLLRRAAKRLRETAPGAAAAMDASALSVSTPALLGTASAQSGLPPRPPSTRKRQGTLTGEFIVTPEEAALDSPRAQPQTVIDRRLQEVMRRSHRY